MEKPANKSQQIKIEFDENSTSTEYSNFVVVTHSAAEFVLDYIRVLPGMAKAKVKSSWFSSSRRKNLSIRD